MRTRHGRNIVLDSLACPDIREIFHSLVMTCIASRDDVRRRLIIGAMAEQGNAALNTMAAGKRRRYWNWLLATPLLLLVYPGFYARLMPELFGFPFFYWYQFAVVVATALLTGVVYWLTRNPAEEGANNR